MAEPQRGLGRSPNGVCGRAPTVFVAEPQRCLGRSPNGVWGGAPTVFGAEPPATFLRRSRSGVRGGAPTGFGAEPQRWDLGGAPTGFGVHFHVIVNRGKQFFLYKNIFKVCSTKKWNKETDSFHPFARFSFFSFFNRYRRVTWNKNRYYYYIGYVIKFNPNREERIEKKSIEIWLVCAAQWVCARGFNSPCPGENRPVTNFGLRKWRFSKFSNMNNFLISGPKIIMFISFCSFSNGLSRYVNFITQFGIWNLRESTLL